MHNQGIKLIEENLPTPVSAVRLPISDCEVKLKRDDLIHPAISGNKWRKLKGFLSDHNKVYISCGGHHSNHLYAFAHLTDYIDNDLYAILRGRVNYESNVVEALRSKNVNLLFLDRSDYRSLRKCNDPWEFFPDLPEGTFIPEGGKGLRAHIGLADLASELREQVPPSSVLCFSCGTGTTLAGVVKELGNEYDYMGLKMFSDGGIEDEFLNYGVSLSQVQLIYDKAIGKFAGRYSIIEEYIRNFYRLNQILLDPIYTAKLTFVVDRMIENNVIDYRKVVLYHSGGLNGVYGYVNRYPEASDLLQFLRPSR